MWHRIEEKLSQKAKTLREEEHGMFEKLRKSCYSWRAKSRVRVDRKEVHGEDVQMMLNNCIFNKV